MHITDMDPMAFVEALAKMEVAAVRAKVRGDSDTVAVDNDVALDLVRLATSAVRAEIEAKKVNDGVGYRKTSDPWALAMEVAEAVR